MIFTYFVKAIIFVYITHHPPVYTVIPSLGRLSGMGGGQPG